MWIQRSYSPETPNLGQIWRFLEPRHLEVWRMTFENNRAPLLCYFKLCAAFCTHWWIQIGVTVRETPNLGKIRRFFESCDLEVWRMILKNNRVPLRSNIKLYVSFRHHMWIQTGVTVGKRLTWVVTSVTLTFDLWPWPFAWTLPWSLVITPEIFMMIWWWEHSQKGVTDRQTDGRTDGRTDRKYHSGSCLVAAKNKTTLERRKTLGHHRSINRNMIIHFANQSQTCQLLKI